VQRICEAHDTVMRSYYQQIHGSSGADAMTPVDGEHWRTSVCANNSHFLKKGETGQSLSKMSKSTALYTEGTAQVSELLNISDTAKKLY